jgi:hypothetical protein
MIKFQIIPGRSLSQTTDLINSCVLDPGISTSTIRLKINEEDKCIVIPLN